MEQKNITVAAMTARKNDPASFFRIRQHIPALSKDGITVRDYISCDYKWYLPGVLKAVPRIPAIIGSRKADIVWVSRSLVYGYETFERFLKRPRVLDVDDAVWLGEPFGRTAMPRIAKAMDAITAGNKYLADWFSKYCKNVHIVPTAVDLSRYCQRSPESMPKGKFVIGWTGLASNYKYLNLVERPLNRFLNDHPDSEVLVIAEKKWQSQLIAPERIKFIQWSRETEATGLHQMSVGIMPLPDDDWSRGKCSFKMLQYMAMGLPVVVSPVGMNKEILEQGKVGLSADSEDSWYQALEELYENINLQIEMGNTGRQVVEKYYSADVVSQSLAGILKKYAT